MASTNPRAASRGLGVRVERYNVTDLGQYSAFAAIS